MKKIDKNTPKLNSILIEPRAVHKPTTDHTAFEMTLVLQGDSEADISTVRALIDSNNLKEVIVYLTQQLNRAEAFQTPRGNQQH
jgi:hypothetical protein